MVDVLKPTTALLCKLGSIAVHTREYLSFDGHDFDREVINSLLNDPELKAWLKEMDGLALLPKQRKSL